MESDVIYFRRRADEEYLAANHAGPFVAFRAHRELAARFTDLADAIEAAERSFDAKTDDAPGPAAEAEHEQQRATLWI